MSAKKLIEEADATRTKLREPAKSAAAVVPDAPPAVRKGEDSMSSRPFRLTNFLGYLGGALPREKAKIEADLGLGFRKALEETNTLIQDAGSSSQFYPLSRSFLPDQVSYHKATSEIVEASAAGVVGADPEEMRWLAKRVFKAYTPEFEKTAMSYLTDSTGGALVAPPEFGELIPLMRNKSALDRAGARQVPLPPQGKWIAPRITGPSTGYWIGENTAITESNLTTGTVSMMAKKLAVLCRVPNELFKYASAASDAMLREDIAKTLALGIDYDGLYGPGGGRPKGLINYDDSNELYDYAGATPAPAGLGTNGNVLRPEDGFLMSAVIEDRNFDVDQGFKWIMRPKQWGRISANRADAVTAGDGAGVFVQSLTRLLGDSVGKNWCGYEVIRSSQVRNDQTKGAGTALSEAFGGMWNEMIVGMYGAVEFASNPFGEATFIADQTLIRGILHADTCLRYPGAFVWYKQLVN